MDLEADLIVADITKQADIDAVVLHTPTVDILANVAGINLTGAVVTVASEASLGAGASGVSFAASKHGVIGIVRHVCFYSGPKGIRSNAVLPGPVATNIAETAMPQSQRTAAVGRIAS